MGTSQSTKPSGQPSTRQQLAGRIGDVSQLASGRAVRLQDGSEDGVRAIDVRVAGGIHALVLVDRGLDVGPAWYAGQPLAWMSSTGITHPSFWSSDAWLRTFYGGLVFTAGLQSVGAPSSDEDEEHGIHGRIGNLPARNVTVETVEEDDRLVLVIHGSVRETSVYGVDLELRRTLRFPVGEPLVQIHDEIVNLGYSSAPLFVLYHVNPGYPVLDEGARLVMPSAEVVGNDEASQRAVDEHADFPAPVPGFEAQVFEHRFGSSVPDTVSVGIVNEAFEPTDGIGLMLSYRRSQLPQLWQWRMLGEGMYVTGIEPANCALKGRAWHREQGLIPQLAAGASEEFDIEIRAAIGSGTAALMDQV